MINVMNLLHRCIVNLSLSFGSVRELYSQSVDLRQGINSLAALLQQYSAQYTLQSN